MSARYRIVHFVADPFIGGRVPVAALVETSEGVRLARAQYTPDTRCLGGRAHAAVLQMSLTELEDTKHAFDSPPSLGMHVVIDDHQTLPDEISNPVDWVRKCVLPKPPGAGLLRGGHRSTAGMRFLRRYNVDQFVEPTFKPQEDGADWVDSTMGLQTISQWVPSVAGDVLLLEPVSARRLQLADDVRDIASRFIGYRWAKQNHRLKRSTRLIAYVVDDVVDDGRKDLIARLRDSADEVIDGTIPAAREAFFNEMRVAAGDVSLTS